VKKALVAVLWLSSTGALYGQSVKPLLKLEAPAELRFAVVCDGGGNIAGVAREHDVYVWSLPSGTRRAVSVTGGQIRLMACRGKVLAVGFRDGTVVVFDAAGSERRRIDMKHDLAAIALSADGELLAVATLYSPVQVWDVASGKLLWTGSTDFGNTTAIGIAPEGNLIVAADGDTHLRAYDRSGKLVYSTDSGLLEPFDLSLSADGKKFAVAGAEGTIELYDSATGKKLKKSGRGGNPIFAVAMAPEGRKVIALELDAQRMEPAEIGYWDTANEEMKKLAVEPKTVIGFGKNTAQLVLVQQETPGKISVNGVE
jgi:WD40 repeat protein